MDGTVLIADDDKSIRKVLSQALVRAGCKVQTTASLATLIRWIKEGKGDLVISDVFMPDGNGIEALSEIKIIRPSLPVIIISAQKYLTEFYNSLGFIQQGEGYLEDGIPHIKMVKN